MKTVFFALLLTLVSSSAFATGPLPPCELSIIQDSKRIVSDAQSFVADVEDMERMQIEQDGRSSLSGDTLGRAERAREVVTMVNAIVKDGLFDYQLSSALCEAKLDVSVLLAR